ncbi:MaoC family dehydratase [Anaerovorax odorimutans]|uniref:MaoC family dehydratase n=1 Tax=Anaerovorax odorimutans TaxID=109327 RepID=A0ABT1RQN8_9FIRM|nr:MaoC family dehydratase [Anaerovorax odorimutans]MCQ4637211.1 MaoC family dehydratase [Anaerovorax odorimutans]
MGDIRNFSVGDKAAIKQKVTEQIIGDYADISGDRNPIHMDTKYAEETVFGERIAHGLFCQALVSNVIGNKLPGEGAILLTERINYRKPVYIGDEIECVCEIKEILSEKNQCLIAFDCINQMKECILDGEALVLLL